LEHIVGRNVRQERLEQAINIPGQLQIPTSGLVIDDKRSDCVVLQLLTIKTCRIPDCNWIDTPLLTERRHFGNCIRKFIHKLAFVFDRL
jgi:hypothetical protein